MHSASFATTVLKITLHLIYHEYVLVQLMTAVTARTPSKSLISVLSGILQSGIFQSGILLSDILQSGTFKGH